MRFSYLELYVVHNHAELQTVDIYTYIQDVTDEEWIKAADGLMFFFNEFDDPSLRSGYIKIPEVHPLFNWGVLDDSIILKDYTSFHNYGIKQIQKAGIPVTLEGTLKYNNDDY